MGQHPGARNHGSVVVTGGGGGIGTAIVRRLAGLGPVVVIDRSDQHQDAGSDAVRVVVGDAADPALAGRAAALA